MPLYPSVDQQQLLCHGLFQEPEHLQHGKYLEAFRPRNCRSRCVPLLNQKLHSSCNWLLRLVSAVTQIPQSLYLPFGVQVVRGSSAVFHYFKYCRVSVAWYFFTSFREIKLESILRYSLSKIQQDNSFILSGQFRTCWNDDKAKCFPQGMPFWRSTASVRFSCCSFIIDFS